MKKDLSQDDLIKKFLINAYKKGFESCAEKKSMRSAIEKFIHNLQKEIYPNTTIRPFKSNGWEFKDLIRETCNLLIYRSMLGLANTDKNYEDDYLKFIQDNPDYNDALNNQNPFLLKMHLTKLYNEITYINSMHDGKIKKIRHSINQFDDYLNELVKTHEKINRLDEKKYGLYKGYLCFLSHYALAVAMYDANNVKHYNLKLAKLLLTQAYSIAYILENFSINSKMIDFLTFGKGIFFELQVKNFNDFKENILSLNIWSNEEKISCIENASRKLMRLQKNYSPELFYNNQDNNQQIEHFLSEDNCFYQSQSI